MPWLFKTEPSTYSFSDLLSDFAKNGKTAWNGVRNFQARNFLKEAKRGDLVLIYHSSGGSSNAGDCKAVVGIAEITKPAYPDVDPSDPKTEWVQVDLKPIAKLPSPVPLSILKKDPELSKMLLIKQSRLSVMPVESKHFEKIKKLGAAVPK